MSTGLIVGIIVGTVVGVIVFMGLIGMLISWKSERAFKRMSPEERSQYCAAPHGRGSDAKSVD